MRRKKEILSDIFNAARSAVDPGQAVRSTLSRKIATLHAASTFYDLNAFDRVVVIGAGKAAAHMAAAVEAVLGDKVHSGTVVVKYGHTAPLRIIEQIEAAHPIPDDAGMKGTRKILATLRSVDVRTLVICLLSGGGSALLVDPLPGITLEDKQKCTDLLLRAGASVYELNTVLKHLSGVKGGRLARAAYPASVLTLTLSDVIGDRIDLIASGPMAPGNSTFCEAAGVIEKLKLRYKLPERVAGFIERGVRGEEPETANSREACFFRTKNIIVGGMAQALFSAGNKAKESGYVTDLMISQDRGPLRRLAHVLAKKALRIRDGLVPGESRCLLFCGESRAAGDGGSGRNQELALAFAQEIAGIPGITLLSAGTDESAQAAAVVVDGTTCRQARNLGLQLQSYLDSNDPGAFFKKLGSSQGRRHQRAPRPTGINVLDLQAIFLEA